MPIIVQINPIIIVKNMMQDAAKIAAYPNITSADLSCSFIPKSSLNDTSELEWHLLFSM